MKGILGPLSLSPQTETRVGIPIHHHSAFAVLLTAIVVVQNLGGSVEAQSPPVDTPTLRSIMLEKDPDQPGVQERLDALIESTQRAREVRESAVSQPSAQQPAEPLNPFAASAGAAPLTTGAESNGAVAPTGNATRSMSEIRERIRILQRLRRDQQMTDAFRQANPIPGGVAAPSLSPPRGDVTDEMPTGDEQSAPAVSAIDASLETPAAEEVTAPLATPEASLPSKRILSTRVNTFALGESLYQTGNFESALKAFQQVDVTPLSQSDRTWLDLLIALCQRRTGDFSTAEGTLREIANEESTDYPVKAAQWWLKHASASHETTTKMNALSSEFDSLLERANSHVNR